MGISAGRSANRHEQEPRRVEFRGPFRGSLLGPLPRTPQAAPELATGLARFSLPGGALHVGVVPLRSVSWERALGSVTSAVYHASRQPGRPGINPPMVLSGDARRDARTLADARLPWPLLLRASLALHGRCRWPTRLPSSTGP